MREEVHPHSLVTRQGRADLVIQVGRVQADCGHDHEAVYSHEGQWGQGPIYVVVCEGLSDYYTAERVVFP